MWFFRRRVALSDLHTGLTGLEALLRKADIARDEGDAETAASDYASALKLAPDRNDIKVQLGNMLKDAGRLREADEIYREAQAADPDDADICVQRGHVHKLMGDRKAALEQYRRAAAINPDSWAAAEELAEAGFAWQQQQRFEVHFRAGGSETIMRVTRQLAAMREALDNLAAQLPNALGQTAFPVESYDVFREVYTVPPPPPGPRTAVSVLLLADREDLPAFYSQIAAVRDQTRADWTLLVIGSEPERRDAAERAAKSDPRIRVMPTEAGESAAAAEWRVARGVTEGWIVLLGQGAVLQRQALDWFGAAPALGPADAFVTDEDQARIARGVTIRSEPIFRQVVDYETLLEANVFGETVAIAAPVYADLSPVAPEGSVARARGRLLLELARYGRVGHIPHPLVSRLDAARASLPEHRLAIADHIAAHGFADRLVVAKGESGPTHWRATKADTPIAVIIPTRDNPHDLRHFVRSLRETAEVPDGLRIVIVENGSTQPESRALLDELRSKRFVTVLSEPPPFNWSRLNNVAVRTVDAPIVVFANDDMLMLTERWDERLRGLLDRDDIGAVGARLLYGDDTVQHAGILLGWKGTTIHDGLYEAAEAPGPARRLQVTRAVSAVTGAFLATRRNRFLAAGGFDEVGLPVAHSDIDYCLRLREAGQKIVWTPAISLRHYESKTRGMDHLRPEKTTRYEAEQAVMEARWGPVLDSDPSMHPIWFPATMPFRLLAAPSQDRVLAHIRSASRTHPWSVRRRSPDRPDCGGSDAPG